MFSRHPSTFPLQLSSESTASSLPLVQLNKDVKTIIGVSSTSGVALGADSFVLLLAFAVDGAGGACVFCLDS